MEALGWWTWLAAAAAIAAWWIWRGSRQRPGSRPRWRAGTSAGPGDTSSFWQRLRARWPARAPDLEVSAVAPGAVEPAASFRVEVVLATAAAMPEFLARVAGSTPRLQAWPPRPLFATVQRDAVVEFTVECSQPCTLTPTWQRVAWSGKPVAVGFQISGRQPLAGEQLLIDFNLFVDRICIGHLPIDVRVAAAEATPAHQAQLRRTERVFMSYNHHDRSEVIQVARALRRFGIEVYMDQLCNEGGDDWRARLEQELDRCDVFMLFWSASAAASEWVVRETAHALARNRSSGQRLPRIVTHLLGPPPVAKPPPGLESLHFNDPLYAQWEAAMSTPPA